jgi:hypothetical protein
MRVTITADEGTNYVAITDTEVLCISDFLRVCLQAAQGASFVVEEIVAITSDGDEFSSQDT